MNEHRMTIEMQRPLKRILAVCICALVAVLVASGCTIDPTPSPPATSPPGSQASQVTDASAAGSSPTPKPTSSPSPTLAATAVPSPTPTATPVPSPTATPMPALRRLTQGDCCTQPFWSPNSRQVLFIDKPNPDLPTGIWAVDVTQPRPTPELLTERIAFYTPDLTLRTELNEGRTVIERLTDAPSATASEAEASASEKNGSSGESSLPNSDSTSETTWEVPSEGQPVYVSPGQTRIAWQKSNDDLPTERRTTQVWVADLDGSTPQMVADLPRGGFSGWISDDVMLLTGRESLDDQEQALFALSLVDESRVELARGERLRGGLLSPDGLWLAYFVALDEDAAQNALWLVSTDGSVRHKLERDLFGAYQWRDTHRLLVIPFQPEATSHEIWEFDAETGQARWLTDGLTPFKIANGDWSVSPDGQYVAFVESRDRNIWLLTLPD